MPASEQDLEKGLDFTAKTDLQAVDCNNLVDQCSPASDKGLIVVTTDIAGVPDAPDAATTTKWKRYLWLRIMPATSGFALYAWNPAQLNNINYSSGTGFITTYWNSVTVDSIPASSIEGYMIVNGTITKEKIESIDVSQIEGFTAANYVLKAGEPNSAGDIAGNYNDGLTIQNNKVTTAKILDDAITTAKILDENVTLAKIVNGTANYILQMNAAGTALAYIRNYFAELQTLGAANQIPAVNGAGTDLEWKDITGASGAVVKTYTETFNLAEATLTYTTAAHGLGGQPHGIQVQLKCIGSSAAHGYAVGDLVDIWTVIGDVGSSPYFTVCSPVAATTIIVGKLNGDGTMIKKDGTLLDPITSAELCADFDLVVSAYRFQ